MPSKPYKWLSSPFTGYTCSAAGQVRSGKNPIAIHQLPDGTPVVNVKVAGRGEQLPVDVLVAFAFLGPPPENPYLPRQGYEVRHLNGDKRDCRAENLAWCVNGDYAFRFYSNLMRGPDSGGVRRFRASVYE